MSWKPLLSVAEFTHGAATAAEATNGNVSILRRHASRHTSCGRHNLRTILTPWQSDCWLTSAPDRSSSLMMSGCPIRAATCRGVFPFCKKQRDSKLEQDWVNENWHVSGGRGIPSVRTAACKEVFLFCNSKSANQTLKYRTTTSIRGAAQQGAHRSV